MRKQALGEYAGVEVRAAALDHEGNWQRRAEAVAGWQELS